MGEVSPSMEARFEASRYGMSASLRARLPSKHGETAVRLREEN